MRTCITIILLFTSLILVAQGDTLSIREAMQNLDKALLEKDSVALSRLLHNRVSFGHSNGWVQSGKEVWKDLSSGKLVYKKIDNSQVAIAVIDKKWATVRTSTAAEGKVGDKDFSLVLHVLQVWMKTKKGWKLLARQSAKTN